MDARGMNLIALINIVMAAALAILVALRAIELLCIAGIAIAGALSWITAGASLAAIPPLNALRQTVSSIYSSLRPTIMSFLEISHSAEIVVRDGMPVVAEGKAIVITMGSYHPPATVGFVWPVARPLPTETAPFEVLCHKASQYVTALIELPLQPIRGVLGPVWGAIDGAIGGFADAAAATVCGGAASMPAIPGIDFSQPLPLTPEARDCIDNHQQAACDEAQTLERQRQYNPATGSCTSGLPSGATTSGCQQRLSDAADQCRPRSGANLEGYVYSVREMEYDIWRDEMGREQRETPPRVTQGPNTTSPRNTPMCGQGGSVSDNYSASGSPLCSSESEALAEAESQLDARPQGDHVTVRYTEVVAVLGCKEHRDQPTQTLSGGSVDGGDSRSPQQIKAGANLGDENFQLRGFVIGSYDWSAEDRGVGAANQFRETDAGQMFQGLRNMGRLSTAQAEFFYDGSDGREEWMWNMFWRARLRRFRMPSGLSGDGLGQACSSSNSGSGGGDCSGAGGGSGGFDLGFLERVIIH
jgi:HAMP domain-containing protein